MNRRLFLVSGGLAGLSVVTGLGAFAATRRPAAALKPWEQAGLFRNDPRRFVVEHAILAPNPHNRQPWIVELIGEDRMRLFCDLERRLPQTDPLDRQIVIGLGCFTELASLAASALGYRLEVIPFPEGEPQPRLDQRPVADFAIVREAGLRADPLFQHVKTRRSTKRPYDLARPVPAAALAELARLSTGDIAVAGLADQARVERLRALTWEAWAIESATARTHKESVDLMRIGRSEIEANPDGISLGGVFLEGLALTGQLTRAQMVDPGSSAFRQGQDMYRAMLAATPAYLIFAANDGGRAGELAAGRAYLRANLAATGLGLAMQPVSQALQEFPEMADAKAKVEAALAVARPKRLHMLARLGYGPAVDETPRWAAATRIRQA
jgi:hypothetical protein